MNSDEYKKAVQICQDATPGPWYVVGQPWYSDERPSYVVAGNEDPHIGTPVLDTIDPGIVEFESDAEEEKFYDQGWADLEFAAEARTLLPKALKALEWQRKKNLDLQKDMDCLLQDLNRSGG